MNEKYNPEKRLRNSEFIVRTYNSLNDITNFGMDKIFDPEELKMIYLQILDFAGITKLPIGSTKEAGTIKSPIERCSLGILAQASYGKYREAVNFLNHRVRDNGNCHISVETLRYAGGK